MIKHTKMKTVTIYRFVDVYIALFYYVDTSVSAGVKHSQLLQRGVSILAFAMAMAALRPIELYAVNIAAPRTSKHYNADFAVGHVTKIQTSPIDLGRASWIFTSPDYCRVLAFSSMYRELNTRGNGDVKWAWDRQPTDKIYINLMKEMLGLTLEDVFIPGGCLGDTKMLQDPVTWVKGMVALHTELQHTDIV